MSKSKESTSPSKCPASQSESQSWELSSTRIIGNLLTFLQICGTGNVNLSDEKQKEMVKSLSQDLGSILSRAQLPPGLKIGSLRFWLVADSPAELSSSTPTGSDNT